MNCGGSPIMLGCLGLDGAKMPERALKMHEHGLNRWGAYMGMTGEGKEQEGSPIGVHEVSGLSQARMGVSSTRWRVRSIGRCWG